MRLAETRFTVVAVKTLNDSESNADIVEVSCVKVFGGEIGEYFYALLNPQTLLPEEFTRQTGIYPADVIAQQPLETILPDVARFIDRDVIVWTHSPRRTHALHRYFRLTQPREKELFLQTLGAHAVPELSRHTITALANHFACAAENPHRAQPLAQAGADVLLRLLSIAKIEHSIDTMLELLSFCPAPKKDSRRSKKNLPFDSERLRHYPTLPGVYFMKNRLGEILYIGKAKNLRNRLRSYFQNQSKLAPKIAAMMKQVVSIDVTTVGSELEALLLEARLIKLHQPFFNKKIKDYQGMVFMKVSVNDGFPRVNAAFETDDPGALYFGPFRGKGGLEHRMEILNRVFKLRSCGDSIFKAHAESPCMQFHIDLCSGSCAGKISQADYRESVADFIRYLEQKPSNTVEHLTAKREAYIEALMFEKAAAVHNQLEMLEQLQWRSYGFIRAIEEHNCILVLPDGNPQAVRLLCVLQGQPFEWMTFNPQQDSQHELEIVVDVLMRRMQAQSELAAIPKAMFEEARLLSQWLTQRKEDEGAVIYLNRKSRGQILNELLLALNNDAPLLPEEWDENESWEENDDWERELSAG